MIFVLDLNVLCDLLKYAFNFILIILDFVFCILHEFIVDVGEEKLTYLSQFYA